MECLLWRVLQLGAKLQTPQAVRGPQNAESALDINNLYCRVLVQVVVQYSTCSMVLQFHIQYWYCTDYGMFRRYSTVPVQQWYLYSSTLVLHYKYSTCTRDARSFGYKDVRAMGKSHTC